MAGGSVVCGWHRSSGGFRVDTRLRRPGVPNPLHDFPAIGIAHSSRRCATAESGNFLMNPVSDHFLNLASRFRITKKVFNEFVILILLRLCVVPFGSFSEHLVARLSGRALVSSRTPESFFDFCAKAFCVRRYCRPRKFDPDFLLWAPICQRKGHRPKLRRRAIEFKGNSERSIPGTSYSDNSAILSHTHSWIRE
jgi:hypothetical protein